MRWQFVMCLLGALALTAKRAIIALSLSLSLSLEQGSNQLYL